MKVHIEGNYVEQEGVMESAAFTIKATAKSFDILSNSLYSDKPRAIIRELACNAYDSHIEAGCPERPIEIGLPTVQDRTLYVKDFGTGMSHESVMRLYTTYFESTKTNSDAVIGQLGLGSKSPFAYAASFNVESRFNGMKRIYICMKDEHGLPEIKLMFEGETEEENGITVSLPVRNTDIQQFETAARRALAYFSPVPLFPRNNSYFKPVQVHHSRLEQVADYEVYRRTAEGTSGIFVIQGKVAYPIDKQLLEDAGANPNVVKFAAMDYDLVVPIGAVDVAPSREQLSYNRRTVEYLNTALEKILQGASSQYTKELSEAKTLWDAYMLHYKWIHESALYGHVSTLIPMMWKEHAISNHSITLDVKRTMELRMRVDITKYTLRNGRRGRGTQLKNENMLDGKDHTALAANPKVEFLVVTGKKASTARLKAHLMQKHDERNCTLYMFNISKERIVELIPEIAGAPFLTIDDLPIVRSASGGSHSSGPRERRQKGDLRKWAHKNAPYRGRKINIGSWDVEKGVDLGAGGLYVVMDRNSIVGRADVDEDNFRNVLEAAYQAKIIKKDQPIYGVTPTELKNLTGKKWVDVLELIETKAKKAINIDGIAAAIAMSKLSTYGGKYTVQPRVNYEKIANGSKQKDNLFNQVWNRWMTLVGLATDEQKAMNTLDTYYFRGKHQREADTVAKAEVHSMNELVGELAKAYPMLSYITLDKDMKNLTAMIEYVDLVDANRTA